MLLGRIEGLTNEEELDWLFSDVIMFDIELEERDRFGIEGGTVVLAICT